MRKFFKWVGITLGSLLILILLLSAVSYFVSESTIINKKYQPDDESFVLISNNIQSAAPDMDEGVRLAKIRGCYGCHGGKLGGKIPFEVPMMFSFVAPNLPAVFNRYSDVELERVIRQGIKPDGSSTFGMPSSAYYHLSDKDLSQLITTIRSMPVADGQHESVVSLGIPIRVMMTLGQLDYKGQHPIIAELGPRIDASDTSDLLAYGEYLAKTSCTECHGANLEGAEMGEIPTPDLLVASSYSPEAFAKLMKTGEALGGRENEMSGIALERFTYLNEHEVKALHSYLVTLVSGDR